jgi:hypothetical protein
LRASESVSSASSLRPLNVGRTAPNTRSFSMSPSLLVCRCLAATLFVSWLFAPRIHAGDAPPPPSTPLNGLVKRLAEKRASEKASDRAPAKEELFRPEFRFRRAKTWLLLPDLARQLTSNEQERSAVMELLDTGVGEASRLLGAEGAENDIAAAAALVTAQLWSLARQREIPEPGADRLHAQMAAVLAAPETAAMSDTDKQRYWEYCLGFSVFITGMQEVATEDAAQAALRTLAGAVFNELMGVSPELIDIGRDGIALSAAAERALAQAQPAAVAVPTARTTAPHPSASAAAADRDPTHTAAGVPGITYAPPPGWAKEDAAWATIFRATLPDTNVDMKIDPSGTGRHAGSIFVLPPRPISGDSKATFEAVWREQFSAFELGDSIVHYRSRVRSGLVIHYMGRFFVRKEPSDLRPYAVLYLVDLGGGMVQPITAVVQPHDPSVGMSTFKEESAYRSLTNALLALLDTIRPASGSAPYPAGGYFKAADLRGDWSHSYRGAGATYVNRLTGMSAGIAVNGSTATLRLGTDGTYAFSLGYYAHDPATGSSQGSTKHHGKYRLDGDVVLIEPSGPLDSPFSCCAVGVGTRQTKDGAKRMLVTVTAQADGKFLGPALVPLGDTYPGVMYWYVEK